MDAEDRAIVQLDGESLDNHNSEVGGESVCPIQHFQEALNKKRSPAFQHLVEHWKVGCYGKRQSKPRLLSSVVGARVLGAAANCRWARRTDAQQQMRGRY
jgi:hypothetical protein